MRRDVFQAISDPIRREIIDLLSRKELTINEVAEHFEISRPAISKHIKILKECGIVEIEKIGRERYCHIQSKELIPAHMWIDRFRSLWEQKIDNLEAYLAKIQETNKDNEPLFRSKTNIDH